MFKAVLSYGNILKTSFNAISAIVDEVQIQADEDGLILDAMSRDHLTFVHLELEKELFDEYECDGPVNINVDTEELMKVLKRSRADDMIILGVDEDNFILKLEGEAERIFKIRLIDISYESPHPPDLKHPTRFEVPFDLLKNSIQDIGIFSDKVTFQVDGSRFKAFHEGELGDAMITYSHGEKITRSFQSIFGLQKVKETLKADKFSDSVILELGVDMPLGLTLKTEGAFLKFLVAPRIE